MRKINTFTSRLAVAVLVKRQNASIDVRSRTSERHPGVKIAGDLDPAIVLPISGGYDVVWRFP